MISWSVGLPLLITIVVVGLGAMIAWPLHSEMLDHRKPAPAAPVASDRDAGLVTYEQVARWLSPEIRSSVEVEAGLPIGQRRPHDGISHGTLTGYAQHHARHTCPCQDCHAAFRETQRRFRSRTT